VRKTLAGCEVELPDHGRITISAGRIADSGYQAGLITDTGVTLAPVTFAPAMPIARRIGDQFKKAGYHRKLRNDNLTEQDMKKELVQFRYYGEWLLPDTGLAEYCLDIRAGGFFSGVASPGSVPLTGPH